MIWSEPSDDNRYLEQHVRQLLGSFAHWVGRSLIDPDLSAVEQARRLYHAPFVVLSHNSAADPILNYANQLGLTLFELTWSELTNLPSRQTAEPVHQAERARLLNTVSTQGYIDDYRGVRIAKSWRRFIIEKAIVWNLIDDGGAISGQAATFSAWRFLDSPSPL
ncbi:MAG: MEKHLA domain-containing protein [Candidatus Binatia bacterium]